MLELMALFFLLISFGAAFGPWVGFGAAAAAYILMPSSGQGRANELRRIGTELAEIKELLKERSEK